jgi:IclR family transcriptional regulator, KDG regulon repressor
LTNAHRCAKKAPFDRESNVEIRSVTKAIRLLDMLGEGNGAYGVSELARRLEMDKSSVSRMLRTLELSGYVEQDPVTQRYRLGLALGVLGYKALRRMDLRSAARPLLERLAEATGECAHMAILADRRAFYIDQALPERGVTVDAPIGTLAPLHCTALGKVLLAYQSEADREQLIGGMTLELFTRRTIDNADMLQRHLSGVREQGIGHDDEEYSVGVRCLAAPVFRFDHKICGAIGISGPSPRVTDARICEWEGLLRDMAGELSARLGWDGAMPGASRSSSPEKSGAPA